MKRCLIVVDYQNDFVTGSLGFPEAAALEPRIAQKIRQYRADGGAVLFTFDTHNEDYLSTQEGRYLPVEHCIRSTDGHRLYGQIADLMQEEDPCFYKDVFGSGALYEHLKATPYESTAGSDRALHQAALDVMAGMQIQVTGR